MDEVAVAIEKANQQLGGEWRLPNREEPESLVCIECGKVKKLIKKYSLKLLMNHSGRERKTLGLNNFIGQLTFLLVILLVGFLEVSLISSDWLEIDNFFF